MWFYINHACTTVPVRRKESHLFLIKSTVSVRCSCAAVQYLSTSGLLKIINPVWDTQLIKFFVFFVFFMFLLQALKQLGYQVLIYAPRQQNFALFLVCFSPVTAPVLASVVEKRVKERSCRISVSQTSGCTKQQLLLLCWFWGFPGPSRDSPNPQNRSTTRRRTSTWRRWVRMIQLYDTVFCSCAIKK